MSEDRVGEVWRHRHSGQHALIVSRADAKFTGGSWDARWLERPDSVEILELSLIASTSSILMGGRLYEPTWERAL